MTTIPDASRPGGTVEPPDVVSARAALEVSAVTRVPRSAEVVGVAVHRGNKPARATGGATVDTAQLSLRGFDGEVGQTAVTTSDGRLVVAVGVGDAGSVDADVYRRAAAALVRAAGKAESVVFAVGALPEGVDAALAGQAAAEGAALAAYRFTSFKGTASGNGAPNLRRLTLVSTRPAELQAGAARGATIARAVVLARDLVNEPAGSLTPTRFADIAAEVAGRSGLEPTVFDEDRIEAEGLGGLLGVARGSQQPPRLVRLAYRGRRDAPTVALVGKGITFDSGGLSLKTPEGMMTMKTDMGGAAAVLAAMSALKELRVRANVVGYMPLTENMPGGRAMKPGDVLRARNGKTIEVLNTDAEGRLVLADGLSLAVEEKPAAIIDIATLTGACVAALGRRIAGLMGNDDALIRQLEAAGRRSGEALWHLPLPAQYRRDIDSEVADIKNIGAPGQAGALIAGLFLQEFVDGVPWAHLDIAGPSRSDSADGYLTKGATGFGTRTRIEAAAAFSSR